MKIKVAIIIPCYNESESICGVLEELHSIYPDYDYIVINDYSTDNTLEIATKSNFATVIDLPCNLGIGGAVQTGLKYARDYNYDYAVKFDGDGQHIAHEIGLLLNLVSKTKVNVAIGSRFLKVDDGFKSTFARRVGIKMFSIINSIFIIQHITDNTSGFRAYDKKSIKFLARYYPSFDYPEPEEVVLLGKNGFRIKEVAIKMRARQGGVSSISGLKSIYFMVKVIFAVLMVAFRPRLIKKR